MATKTWNAQAGSAAVAGNWNPSGVPVNGDDLVFPPADQFAPPDNGSIPKRTYGTVTVHTPTDGTGASYSFNAGAGLATCTQLIFVIEAPVTPVDDSNETIVVGMTVPSLSVDNSAFGSDYNIGIDASTFTGDVTWDQYINCGSFTVVAPATITITRSSAINPHICVGGDGTIFINTIDNVVQVHSPAEGFSGIVRIGADSSFDPFQGATDFWCGSIQMEDGAHAFCESPGIVHANTISVLAGQLLENITTSAAVTLGDGTEANAVTFGGSATFGEDCTAEGCTFNNAPIAGTNLTMSNCTLNGTTAGAGGGGHVPLRGRPL